MIADWEMTEAARLLERACSLLEPHADGIVGLRPVVRVTRDQALLVKVVARNTRERSRFGQKALFDRAAVMA